VEKKTNAAKYKLTGLPIISEYAWYTIITAQHETNKLVNKKKSRIFLKELFNLSTNYIYIIDNEGVAFISGFVLCNDLQPQCIDFIFYRIAAGNTKWW